MTVKMEMPGMPFAMPATTTKICIPKGAERDPKHMNSDKDCVMTDMKQSGNKTSWKMRCNRKGEVMEGAGEMSGTPDNSEGTVRLNGMSDGHKIDMTQTYRNKRLGGSCDTEELANKAKAQIAQSCDAQTKDTVGSIYMSRMLLDEKTCPGKKQPFCEALRRDSVRDANVYIALVNVEKSADSRVANACGISMDATTKAICKSLNANNVGALTPYCPAEAKAYRENARRKACEGRSYTAKEDLGKCLAGLDVNHDEDEGSTQSDDGQPQRKGRARANANAAGAGATGTAKPGDDARSTAPAQPSQPNPAQDLLDGAKKLKGLFGL
jgi:hypothetical protein